MGAAATSASHERDQAAAVNAGVGVETATGSVCAYPVAVRGAASDRPSPLEADFIRARNSPMKALPAMVRTITILRLFVGSGRRLARSSSSSRTSARVIADLLTPSCAAKPRHCMGAFVEIADQQHGKLPGRQVQATLSLPHKAYDRFLQQFGQACEEVHQQMLDAGTHSSTAQQVRNAHGQRITADLKHL